MPWRSDTGRGVQRATVGMTVGTRIRTADADTTERVRHPDGRHAGGRLSQDWIDRSVGQLFDAGNSLKDHAQYRSNRIMCDRRQLTGGARFPHPAETLKKAPIRCDKCQIKTDQSGNSRQKLVAACSCGPVRYHAAGRSWRRWRDRTRRRPCRGNRCGRMMRAGRPAPERGCARVGRPVPGSGRA